LQWERSHVTIGINVLRRFAPLVARTPVIDPRDAPAVSPQRPDERWCRPARARVARPRGRLPR
jgi:hypothetical protein